MQVVLGGGQDASAVTTTDHRAGKFEAKFYDKVNLTTFIYIFCSRLLSLQYMIFFSNDLYRFFKKRLEVLKGILDL